MIAAATGDQAVLHYLARYMHYLPATEIDPEYTAAVMLFLTDSLSILQAERLMVLPYGGPAYGNTTFATML